LASNSTEGNNLALDAQVAFIEGRIQEAESKSAKAKRILLGSSFYYSLADDVQVAASRLLQNPNAPWWRRLYWKYDPVARRIRRKELR